MNKIIFPQFKKSKTGFRLCAGKTILDYIREAGIHIYAECSGRGTCGKCIVRIEKGKKNLSKTNVTEKPFLSSPDERLACQAKITGTSSDTVVYIKEYGSYKILEESLKKKISLFPSVHLKAGRVVNSAGEMLDSYRGGIYGLAVDIGTTTLVLDVVDLQSGKVLFTASRMNPQVVYGNDVISRIEYITIDKEKHTYLNKDESNTKSGELKSSAVNALNGMLEEFIIEGKPASKYIYDAVISGNSTMRNIFMGIDVTSLGFLPFEPINRDHTSKKAKELGLEINANAAVYAPPLIGGQLGADAVANILFTGMHKSKNISMILDIGTNCEIMLGNRTKILCASYPAGGAFEGAGITCGTGAISGAITDITMNQGQVVYHTIGNSKPVGICGSGLIDLLSELLKCGIITKDAKLKNDFTVTDSIKLTQHDVHQLITAKAGLITYQHLLIKYFGIKIKDIDKIYLSGAFGSYINVKNAIKSGILAEFDEKKVIKIGNGSLAGAREMLISRKNRDKIENTMNIMENVKPNEREKDLLYMLAENMYYK